MNRPVRRQRLALLLLVLTSITFITLDYRMKDGSALSALRAGVGTVVGPAQRALSAAVSPVVGAVRDLGSLGSSGEQVRRLRQQNQRLTQRLRSAELDTGRVAQLRTLGLLAGLGQYRIVPGRVVALGPAVGFEWTATIDLGGKDGIRPGMTVVDGDGLVGRVKTVFGFTSVVLLAVDPGSSVGSRLEGSGELGLTQGDGLSPLRLQLLDPQAPLRAGDRLVTGPYGETTYAAGVPIGAVRRVSRATGSLVRTAEVTPYVDFTALDVVGVVVVPPRSDPGAAVLPPRTASPTRPAGG